MVYGEGKTIEEILEIADRLSAPGVPVLLTRLSPEKLAALEDQFPDARLNPRGRTCLDPPPAGKGPG